MSSVNAQKIAVAASSESRRAKAAELADRLQLPLADLASPDYDFFLVATETRLELRQNSADAPGAVSVDFTSGRADYRRRRGGGRRQPLARAIGIKGKLLPTVLDATAGLGRDAFVLACLGCRVFMAERSPIIAALLEDGLRRAETDPEVGETVRERMRLILADSKNPASLFSGEIPDVIYLDPMYPLRRKSALVKKEMRLLRKIVGKDEDAPQLLATALSYAAQRVVVKRPKSAPMIDGPRPSLTIRSKNSRFDVYIQGTKDRG